MDEKFPKKEYPGQSHFTNYIAKMAFEAAAKVLGEALKKDPKNFDPLDGDETEAVSKKFLRLLDEHQGNT